MHEYDDHLTNRQHFLLVYSVIDQRNLVKHFQDSTGTTNAVVPVEFWKFYGSIPVSVFIRHITNKKKKENRKKKIKENRNETKNKQQHQII